MLMANSVEGRFPFLDWELVSFANQLPARHKLLGLDEKHLLKVACGDLLPESIRTRPKQPYRAPDAASFFVDGRPLEWVAELTSNERIARAGVFNATAVERLVGKCRKVDGRQMSNTDNMRLVAVLSTMLLHEQFVEGDGRGDASERPPEPVTQLDQVEAG
jgi:asparagine synthase (glutamine-hydrolysing)